MGKASGAVSSARELYDRESTFRAGIRAWVKERRCDLRLVDLLLEYGLTAQAEYARWAATQPSRPSLEGRPKGKESGKQCGPFPCVSDRKFYWYDCGGGRPWNSHDVPRRYFGRQVDYRTDRFK